MKYNIYFFGKGRFDFIEENHLSNIKHNILDFTVHFINENEIRVWLLEDSSAYLQIACAKENSIILLCPKDQAELDKLKKTMDIYSGSKYSGKFYLLTDINADAVRFSADAPEKFLEAVIIGKPVNLKIEKTKSDQSSLFGSISKKVLLNLGGYVDPKGTEKIAKIPGSEKVVSDNNVASREASGESDNQGETTYQGPK